MDKKYYLVFLQMLPLLLQLQFLPNCNRHTLHSFLVPNSLVSIPLHFLMELSILQLPLSSPLYHYTNYLFLLHLSVYETYTGPHSLETKPLPVATHATNPLPGNATAANATTTATSTTPSLSQLHPKSPPHIPGSKPPLTPPGIAASFPPSHTPASQPPLPYLCVAASILPPGLTLH